MDWRKSLFWEEIHEKFEILVYKQCFSKSWLIYLFYFNFLLVKLEKIKMCIFLIDFKKYLLEDLVTRYEIDRKI